MMYSFGEIEPLTTKIRWMATELLGDRVSAVQVEAMDHNDQIGIAIRTPEGWRHGVNGMASHAMADPETWTRSACVAITAWLDAKAEAHDV